MDRKALPHNELRSEATDAFLANRGGGGSGGADSPLVVLVLCAGPPLPSRIDPTRLVRPLPIARESPAAVTLLANHPLCEERAQQQNNKMP
jgi:hypothetical protein